MSKKLCLLLFVFFIALSVFSGDTVGATPVNPAFEDDNLYNLVIEKLNYYAINGKNDRVASSYSATDDELSKVTGISYGSFSYPANKKIASTKGIEKLTGLKSINFDYNTFTSIDLTKCTNLTSLSIGASIIPSIDLSRNKELISLSLIGVYLDTVDLSKNEKIQSLWLVGNDFDTINLSKNINLKNLNLRGGYLETIDLSYNTSLTHLNLQLNKFKDLDITKKHFITICPIR